MFIGTLRFDLLLGDVHTLKQKRSIVRPLVAEVRRRFDVAVAEVNYADLYRRSEVGVAVVSGEMRRCHDVLNAVESHVAGRPEVELLSARRWVHSDDDET